MTKSFYSAAQSGEKRSLRDDLRHAHERRILLEAIEAAPGPFAVYDSEDWLVACNETYRIVHEDGFRALEGQADIRYADLLRETLRASVPADQLEQAVADRVAAQRTGDGSPRDRYYPGKGWFRVAKRRTPSGAVAGVATEITELVETTQALQRARSEIGEAYAQRGRFVAYMSHELRNPLNAILGIAGELRRTGAEAGLVDALESAGRQMLEVLDDVLDHARVDQGKVTLRPAEFDPRDLFAEIADRYAPLAGAKGLRFDVVTGELADGSVVTDRRHLGQIIANLLSNAIKFSGEGAVTLEARRLSDDMGRVWLVSRVTDEGPGMSAEECAELFSEFARMKGSEATSGTGLGLAIAQGYARALGGQLSVASAPGEGSTFTLAVPCGIDSNDPVAPPAATGNEGLAVLAAEDNEVNRIILRGMLREKVPDLTVVGDGKAALDAAGARDFDVILLDTNMPVMDGLTALRAIRQAEDLRGAKPARVVSVSAHLSDEHRAAAYAAGADFCLGKPFSREALLGALLGGAGNGAKRADQ